jgi:dihydroxyacetone kinase DhaKLM complex PTS-EIIA-like component DhaM
MKPDKPVNFFGIPRSKYKKIRARIRAQADEMTVLNDMGTATLAGVTVDWLYSEAEQLLTVTCTRRPWWISAFRAAARIKEQVEEL